MSFQKQMLRVETSIKGDLEAIIVGKGIEQVGRGHLAQSIRSFMSYYESHACVTMASPYSSAWRFDSVFFPLSKANHTKGSFSAA